MKEEIKNPVLWVLVFIAIVLVIKFFPKKETKETEKTESKEASTTTAAPSGIVAEMTE